MKNKFWFIFGLLFFGTPLIADAHSFLKGVNDFYNGLLHPFFSLPHLLVVIGLGFLIGRQSEKIGTRISLGLIASLALSLTSATFFVGFAAEKYLLFGTGIIGLCLVISRPLSD